MDENYFINYKIVTMKILGGFSSSFCLTAVVGLLRVQRARIQENSKNPYDSFVIIVNVEGLKSVQPIEIQRFYCGFEKIRMYQVSQGNTLFDLEVK